MVRFQLPSPVQDRLRRSVAGLLSGAVLAGAILVPVTSAQAQAYFWGGVGSTTTTTDYNQATNWSNPPGGAPPVAAGQFVYFNATGSASVAVTAGPIAPDSWLFGFNSQSYSISGAAVNFSPGISGIFSIANSGQTISISNNIGVSAGGVHVSQQGASTLILAGTNTYSGGTFIFAGTVRVTNNSSVGSGAVTLDGGAFQADGVSNLTFTNAFKVNTTGGTVDNNATLLTLSGLISNGNGATGALRLTDSSGGFGTTVLSGANTYSGGTTVVGTTVQVTNNSSVGTGGVTLSGGTFQADGLSNLTFSNNFKINGTGGTVDANGIALTISGNITDGIGPGALTIVDSTLGAGRVILTGSNTYTGGTSICTCATLQLGDATHTGSILGTVFNENVLDVVNANTAGITSINNDGRAITTFFGANTASSIAITNQNGGQTDFGVGFGTDTATAGNATIVNRSGGFTVFSAMTTASNATITNRFGGLTVFDDHSTAGNANITNRLGGSTLFQGHGSAGNATITNNSSGGFFGPGLGFFEASTAGTATIINNGFIAFGAPGAGDTASADHAVITNNAGSGLEFNALTTAGNATITTLSGGAVAFFDNSTGGNAQFITNGTGYVDFSGSIGPNSDGRITAGSIAGSGIYYIGAANTLIVGSNNLSTEVSGVIADFNPCGCGSTGPGALEKTGTGTMILSGTNTYTGGTTITGGTLQLGNGGTTGSVLGDVVDNANFAVKHSDALTFGGVISGSGAFQQLGTGATTLTATNTYTGPTTVSAGTLIISATGSITSDVTNNATFNNAGTVTGALTNNATAGNSGTITGGLTNFGTVNAAGVVNGAIANNAGTFTVTGVLTSNSTFANAAAGTLAVGAAGAYTLQGTLTNSGAVTVAGGGQLIATAGGITNNAGGTVTVAVGGTVKDDLNNAGVVTNNGTYIANVASNSGMIINNLTWTGTVSNAGTFNNNAGGSVSGLLTNSAGVTTNNGALNGGAAINGGTLAGTGTVSNLTIGSGGSFLPGNGTPGSSMTVSGNLAFQSGALYLVQLNSVTSTFANVTGTAALAGTVGASFAPGSSVMKQYMILTAGGGHSGGFNGATVTGAPSALVASLSYDPTHAYLNFALDFGATPGLNVNQRNVGNALTNFFNANGGIPFAFASLTPAGLSQVSGETATGSQQTTFDAMNLFLGLLTDPFIDGRGDGVIIGPSTPQFAEEGDSTLAYAAKKQNAGRDAFAKFPTKAEAARNNLFDPHWSLWGAAYGGDRSTDGNAALGSNNSTARAFGFVAGADYRLSPATLAGFALAGGGTNFSVNGFGSGRSDLFQAGAFVRHNVGAAYVSGALAYGWQDVTTDRIVTVAGIDRLHAEFNANAWSGRVEGGYRFVTPWMGITPYAAGQFTTYSLPAYAEQVLSGAGTFALNYAAKDVTASRSELGVRSDRSFAMQSAILTLRGRLAWAHDFNSDRNISAVFQTLPGASFVVNGAAQAHDSALTTASAEIKWLNGWSAAATFEGEFSGVTRSYAGKGVARYTW